MATALGNMPVGSTVKIKENGVAQEYIVINQGNPDTSKYDSSCSGTWLLRKYWHSNRSWSSTSSSTYDASYIHSWLNSTMLAMYDSNIQSAIKQVKIPYHKGSADYIGSSGVSCKVFLLSIQEVGLAYSYSSGNPNDGALLGYFLSGYDTEAKEKRYAYMEGTTGLSYWWTRTPDISYASGDAFKMAACITTTGTHSSTSVDRTAVVRPALIMPTDMFVDDSGNVTFNTAPSVPSSISVPSTITDGDTITVSWGASTDAEGNLAGYKLEKSTNGGSSWSQIYQGSATSKTDNITGITQVMYRVKAYDALGLESEYKTSSNVSVNHYPIINCDFQNNSSIGIKTEDFSVPYTITDADNNTVAVTEMIDMAQHRIYTAILGSQNTFDISGLTFMKLSNGEHTLQIIANDGKVSTTYTLTFVKNITSASVAFESGIVKATGKITTCNILVSGDIPDDATLSVEVTNNANDTSPVWEDCTNAAKKGINHLFLNKAAENGFAFNFRLTVQRGEDNIGGYISSITGKFA